MKIGIFSDVHGCLTELQQTLSLLRSLKVDQLVCGGDLVDKGSDSEGVVQLMRDQDIPCVQGNHDAKAAWSWLTNQEPLSDTAIQYLSNLPESLTFTWVGVEVYVAHSNPWNDSSVYVYPSRPKALFQEIAKAVTAQVIILGHTHIPMYQYISETVIINVGAVYGNSSSESVYDVPKIDRHTCGVLHLPHVIFDLYDIVTGKLVWRETKG